MASTLRIVPDQLRAFLRWDDRHDDMAAKILREFVGLQLPRDRELIRQLAFIRVVQSKTYTWPQLQECLNEGKPLDPNDYVVWRRRNDGMNFNARASGIVLSA